MEGLDRPRREQRWIDRAMEARNYEMSWILKCLWYFPCAYKKVLIVKQISTSQSRPFQSVMDDSSYSYLDYLVPGLRYAGQ